MKKLFLILPIFLFIVFLSNTECLTETAWAHNVEEGFIIHMTETGFFPEDLIIPQGATITFENIDTKDRWPASNIHPTHEIYSEFDPKGVVKPGESWKFQFNNTGIWRFHDHVYPTFGGTITVEGEETATSTVEQKPNIIQRIIASILKFFRLNFIPAIARDSKEIFKDDSKLRTYIEQYGPSETIKHLDELSPEFGSCHEQAHVAGRISYDLMGEEAFSKCSAECHSGCYHGATEAYFKEHGTGNLTESLKTLCDKEQNSFFNHQCLHGIGHGLMAWANYDIYDALEACDLLPQGQSSCWTGVFMENIVGGLTDKTSDHFTKYLSNNPQYPCNAVDNKYQSTCYFLQTSRMVELFNADFSKVAKACLDAPRESQISCFSSMGRDAGGINRQNPAGSIKACSYVPDEQLRIACLIGAVQDSFWDVNGQDEAVAFCKILETENEKNACYNSMFNRSKEILNSTKEIKNFCLKFEKEYQNICSL